MVDLYIDDITYERLDVIAEGYKITLSNKHKDEFVHLIITEAETKNLFFALKRRLEINNVIPIRGNGGQK